MKPNASSESENFVQTVMRCLKTLPPDLIKVLCVLTEAPFGRLVQYVIAKTRYEPQIQRASCLYRSAAARARRPRG